MILNQETNKGVIPASKPATKKPALSVVRSSSVPKAPAKPKTPSVKPVNATNVKQMTVKPITTKTAPVIKTKVAKPPVIPVRAITPVRQVSKTAASTTTPSKTAAPNLTDLWAQANGYQGQIDTMLKDGFHYDPTTDAAYKSLEELAQRQAKVASKGAMENMNDRGILNSTITSDAIGHIEQSAQDSVVAQIPNLQSAAYGMYQEKIKNLMGLWDGIVSQAEHERTYQTQKEQWEKTFANDNVHWEKEFAHGVNQDAIDNTHTQYEIDHQLIQDGVSNAITQGDLNVKFGNGAGGGGVGMSAASFGQQLIGKTKYVWGGGRTAADIKAGRFDCSGFVNYAFKQAGIDLGSGNTDTIAKKGIKVSPNDLQPGDIVFFDTYKKNGHVGIYIGNGKFIGAQTKNGVSIADMSKGYFKDKFSGNIRRVTK